jgi:hypothetical protein
MLRYGVPAATELFFSTLADTGAQLLYYLLRGFVGGFTLVDFEGDRSYTGVASATIALADPG